ncbi:MAG: NUDIX hydrolase [Cyclobacteriaceae bacterium]|nr:NUDIX hydrolase [Cyclobacteriaceae bacterium]MCH8516021.1 NUDIX hydrolase [Cyclobacteriaceae bacterium]
MNYCSYCGSADIDYLVPEGDTRKRNVCNSCGMVHYVNPNMVVGTLTYKNDQVLLCKRDIEPRKGYWNVPAGFLELGETVEEGALRETMEEANANVELKQLFCVYNIPHVNQVYLLFLADLGDSSFSAGDETVEADLFAEKDIPWEDIAFSSTKFAIKKFYENRLNPNQVTHIGGYVLTP